MMSAASRKIVLILARSLLVISPYNSGILIILVGILILLTVYFLLCPIIFLRVPKTQPILSQKQTEAN